MANEELDDSKTSFNLSRNEQWCVPMGDPEDPEFWDPTLNGRGLSASTGLGTNPTFSKEFQERTNRRNSGTMYPGRPLEEENNAIYTIAGDRAPATFALSNHLDFRTPNDKKFASADGHGWPNQWQLVQWMKMEKDCLHDELPFGMDTVLIPAKIDWEKAYWCVERPIEGIVFDIQEKFSQVKLATGIDGGVRNSGKLKIPDDLCWSHDKNRVLQICITAMPPLVDQDCIEPDIHGRKICGGLDDWAIMTSACVHCPDTGK